MPWSSSDNDLHQTRVYVHLANRGGGWVLLVERDGQIVATEQCTDWHRVERRRTLLETGTEWRPARVAALLALAAATMVAAPLFAQDRQMALLPEPQIITTAVDFVGKFKGDERPSSICRQQSRGVPTRLRRRDSSCLRSATGMWRDLRAL